MGRRSFTAPREAVLEVEREEDRQAEVDRDVARESGASLRPGVAGDVVVRAVAAVLTERDFQRLQLLEVHVVADLAEDREPTGDEDRRVGKERGERWSSCH